MCLYTSAQSVRTIAGRQCTVALFLPGSTNSVLRIVPEEFGGMGDLRAKIEERIAAGEDEMDAGNKVKSTLP
jgi:hypothetical protein